MTLDIAKGHIFVLDGKEYAIRNCNPWLDTPSESILALMPKRASTKKPPLMVANKRGAPVDNLSNISCSPVWVASSDTREREKLQTPIDLWECYLDGGDTIYHLVLEDNAKNG